jgi:hypothetical protein
VGRVREQSERLARRLLATHRKDEQAIDRIVSTLTKGLGTHDYLVSRSEARVTEAFGGLSGRDNKHPLITDSPSPAASGAGMKKPILQTPAHQPPSF